MKHVSSAHVTWVPAPERYFTGEARFGHLHADPDPDGLYVIGVHFAPGARTGWHSHPGGQTLYVTAGSGIVANAGGKAVSIGAGDVVSVPADELHWHGARAGSFMVHLSITTGGATRWNGDLVDDEQYREAVQRAT